MKKIAVTIGDPGGIGPEVLVKALPDPGLRGCVPIVIGDLRVMQEAVERFRSPLRIAVIESADEARPAPETLWLLEAGTLPAYARNRPDAENGAACVRYIRRAVALALDGAVDAVVTAPVSKESLKLAGLHWPGHTEMLAELTGTKRYAMMLVGEPLKVVLVTIHTALKNVPGLITKGRVLETIRLAAKACAMLGIENPRIAVAGLNPHAGESGIFGDEERVEIMPAIDEAHKQGISVEGPSPPDTVFFRAYHGAVDMVVCMYHDQGLIPLKMLAFEKGVNVTVGLPIIRTSPDHGTAYDIAWKGIGNPSSMIEAINMAIRLRLVE